MKAKEFFSKSQEHHTAMAEHHAKLAKIHGEDAREDLAAAHDGLSKLHAERAEHFSQMHSAAKKTETDELNKVKPSNISLIAPPQVRAVPRYGAPTPEAANVSEEFRKLVAVEHEDLPL